MKEYVIATWTAYGGSIGEAQSDKGMWAIKEYEGLGIGSGTVILSEKRISKEEFEENKKRGVKTI